MVPVIVPATEFDPVPVPLKAATPWVKIEDPLVKVASNRLNQLLRSRQS